MEKQIIKIRQRLENLSEKYYQEYLNADCPLVDGVSSWQKRYDSLNEAYKIFCEELNVPYEPLKGTPRIGC